MGRSSRSAACANQILTHVCRTNHDQACNSLKLAEVWHTVARSVDHKSAPKVHAGYTGNFCTFGGVLLVWSLLRFLAWQSVAEFHNHGVLKALLGCRFQNYRNRLSKWCLTMLNSIELFVDDAFAIWLITRRCFINEMPATRQRQAIAQLTAEIKSFVSRNQKLSESLAHAVTATPSKSCCQSGRPVAFTTASELPFQYSSFCVLSIRRLRHENALTLHATSVIAY